MALAEKWVILGLYGVAYHVYFKFPLLIDTLSSTVPSQAL